MKFSVYFALVLMLLVSCVNEREAPNGLKVKVFRAGEGSFAEPREIVVASLVLKDSRDSVWRDTRKENFPIVFPVGPKESAATEKGLESAFRVLKKGDSVSVTITAQTLFGSQPLPPGVKGEELITCILSVSDITDERGLVSLQQQAQAKQYEESQKLQSQRLTIDTVAIDEWLINKKINALKDKSGLRYVITKLGGGPKPSLESTIIVSYRGSLMENGQIFDQNSKLEYPLSQMIRGWQIGFQLLPKGTQATLYIPSTLGYGINGFSPGIPPNANLIFEVELLDFK